MSWDDLVAYRVPQSHLPLTPVGWALIGSALSAMRNVLSVGADAQGLVLQKSGLLGGSETVYIPWAHMRRGQPPSFPIASFPRETFLIGPAFIALTIPQGIVRAPF
jgi:hypothetical protein